MKFIIQYSKQALKYIKKSNRITKERCDSFMILALKRIYKNEISTVNLKKISGQTDLYRIRYGNIRIIFSVSSDGNIVISLVEAIAPRGDIYKKI